MAMDSQTRTRSLFIVSNDVESLLRGRRGEFFHAGLKVSVFPSPIGALRALWAIETPTAILAPPDLDDMTFEDFASIVNASGRAVVIAGAPADTAHSEFDRLIALGAADVVIVPASAVPLSEIVRSVAPEPAAPTEAPFHRCGDLEMDVGGYRVKWHGREVKLHPSTFGVLQRLMEVCPRTVPVGELLDQLRPHSAEGRLNSLRVQIGRIRKQLQIVLPDTPVPLETVVRVGYRINREPREQESERV